MREVDAEPRKAHRVSAVTKRLKEILVEASEKTFWVRGHLTSAKKSIAGHLFGELIEVDDQGNTVAKVGVQIWNSEFQQIQRKLQRHGVSNALTQSQEICALCSIRFHEVFGLRLTVFDLDPDFGESHVVRHRRMVLERLRQEGLLDRNKALAMTIAPLRIGLITADGSAALADFRETILVSPFAFRIVHAPVAIQGEETARSVRAAVDRLCQLPIDMICIVRGGGSQVDLAWLDDESIARAVALCPIPVWVGIGHEVDRGVLDVIAHESHKTPTEVAKVLVDRLRTLAARLESAEERLRDVCERHSMLADQKLKRMTTGLLHGSRKHYEIHASRFEHLSAQLVERSRRILSHAAQNLAHSEESLVATTMRFVEAADETMSRNHAGLVEGTRKHLVLFNERHRRRADTLRIAVLRAVDGHASRLAASAAGVAASTRGRFLSEQRELAWHTKRTEGAWRLLARSEERLRTRVQRASREAFDRRIAAAAQSLDERARLRDALDPERLLDRGYTLTRDAEGRIVTSVSQVAPETVLRTQLRDGSVVSVVTAVEGGADDRG